jgi:hypothetical protein
MPDVGDVSVALQRDCLPAGASRVRDDECVVLRLHPCRHEMPAPGDADPLRRSDRIAQVRTTRQAAACRRWLDDERGGRDDRRSRGEKAPGLFLRMPMAVGRAGRRAAARRLAMSDASTPFVVPSRPFAIEPEGRCAFAGRARPNLEEAPSPRARRPCRCSCRCDQASPASNMNRAVPVRSTSSGAGRAVLALEPLVHPPLT